MTTPEQRMADAVRGQSTIVMRGHDPVDRGLARGLLAVAQSLAEKRPEHDGGVIDLHDREQVAVPGENSCDPRGGQHVGERQTRLRQEVAPDPPTCGQVRAARCGVSSMKTPSMVLLARHTGEGRLFLPGGAFDIQCKPNGSPRKIGAITFMDASRAETGAQRLTVPFRPDPIFGRGGPAHDPRNANRSLLIRSLLVSHRAWVPPG
jgi:hypothetical protein